MVVAVTSGNPGRRTVSFRRGEGGYAPVRCFFFAGARAVGHSLSETSAAECGDVAK